jgi:phage terminase small subunit
MAKRRKKVADAAEVVEFLTSVLRGNDTEEVVVKDRIKAAQLLGKSYGMFTDKVQADGDSVVQIIDNVPKGDGYD